MADHTLGTGPVQADYAEMMKNLACTIDRLFNGMTGEKEVGFVLMVFPFGDLPGRCNYMSNATRADVTILLREQLAYFEGQSDGHVGRA